MNTNETINACGCSGGKKCCATIVKNYYGGGCYSNGTDSTGGNGDGHSPYIGENGNWFEWSVEANDFIDTGIHAGGHDILITGKETLANKLMDGKPVYQMLIDCAETPLCASNGVATAKQITVNVDHPDIIWVQSAHLFSSSGLVLALPWIFTNPVNNPSNYVPRRAGVNIGGKTTNTCLLEISNSSITGNNSNITAIIQYTKTTDPAIPAI